MSLITREELSAFLAANGNPYFNHEEWGIGTSMTFFEDDGSLPAPLEMSVHTSEESLDDFISGFELKEIDQLHKIGYWDSWRRYLNGYAEIALEHHIIEATLIFRLYKSRTLVTSLEMHFYDEIYRHLTMPEDFLDYVVKNERSLQTANEYRYKY